MVTHSKKHRIRLADPPVDCAACTASHRCWEGAIAADSGFKVKRRAILDKGTRLFEQGERFTAIHILVSGCVKLFETNEEGAERLVAIRLPGELLGAEGWAHGRHPYTAVAAVRTKVCRLQWPQVKACAPSNALLEQLLRKTAAQLMQTTHVWTNLPAVERVAAFLNHFAQHPQLSTKLPLTRAEIGSLLGLAEETVVRAIARLRAQAS